MPRSNGRLRRLLHPLYRYLESQVRPLRYLFLEITQRCNLECLHCGSDCGKHAFTDELTTQEWIALIQGLGRAFSGQGLMPVVSGGEPTCYPDLMQIAGALGRAGFRWGMVTNGYRLEASTLRALQKSGLVSLTLSLDGLEQSHNWLRGRSDSFARAVASIRLAAGSGLPLVDVVTVVNQRNLNELAPLRRHLADLGVKRWRIFSTFPRGRALQHPELLLTDPQVKQLMTWLAEARKQRELPHVDFSCEAYLPEDVDAAVRDEPYFCRAGICIASVLSDGSISACPNIPRTLIQGNVRSDSLERVWRERFGPFRNRSWMRTARCAGCTQWSRCQGNSMHLWDEKAGCTARCYHHILSH